MYKNVCFSITEEQNDWLEEQKEKRKTSKSLMVRQAIDNLMTLIHTNSHMSYNTPSLPFGWTLRNESLYDSKNNLVDDMGEIK